jgi:hypothetical protein
MVALIVVGVAFCVVIDAVVEVRIMIRSLKLLFLLREIMQYGCVDTIMIR